MDPDMNKYDLEHVVTGHARMSQDEWADIYRSAWDIYYTPAHMKTILRAAAFNVGVSHLAELLYAFSRSVEFENVHPLQLGLLRRKYRRDRRHGMAQEPVWRFYPKYAWETLSKHARMIRHLLSIHLTVRRLRRDPARLAYTDLALTAVSDDESFDLFTHNEGARDQVVHVRKIAALTQGTHASAEASGVL
jgi:hypothetical protein